MAEGVTTTIEKGAEPDGGQRNGSRSHDDELNDPTNYRTNTWASEQTDRSKEVGKREKTEPYSLPPHGRAQQQALVEMGLVPVSGRRRR